MGRVGPENATGTAPTRGVECQRIPYGEVCADNNCGETASTPTRLFANAKAEKIKNQGALI